MRSLRPELMVCAYHHATHRKADRALNRWNGFVAYARDPFPTALREVFPSLSSGGYQLVTPEDVLPGFEVGFVKQVEQAGTDTTKLVDQFEPQGRVIAIFHDHSRTQPVVFANALGEMTGYSSHLPVAVRREPLPQRCQFDCGTDRIVTGLLWLLRRLHGTPMPEPVHPQFIEDAAPIAVVWNLIRRERHGGVYQPPSLTDAGRIWLLAHYRGHGVELDPSTAPKRSIQNIFDTRGASGPVNVNLNQGNYGQNNVNFGNQGDVAQGPNASITSVKSTMSMQDHDSIEQLLDIIQQHSANLRLSQEQWHQLNEAMRQLRQSLDQRKLDRPESMTAGRTILELTRDTLVKAAPGVALAALERIAGIR